MIEVLNQTVRDRIERYQERAPVHVIPIANEFGIDVYKNMSFQDGLSGLIKCVDDRFEIHVNGNHPITRQRFTMAHELSHFLLHEDRIGDGVVDDYLYRSHLTSRIEREANELAADILMPEHLLISDYYMNMSISRQADEFWVSPASMDIRLGKFL